MQWKVNEIKAVLKTIPFTVESLSLYDLKKQKNTEHPYHRLNCPDWVNVLPITPDGQAVLIRQSRAGAMQDTLEIPGGQLDPGERDPTLAATRELEEETGYFTRTVLPLGAINPNPAIMTNTVHMFLALNAIPNPQRKLFPDDGEDIEVVTVPTNELDQLVRLRRIDSALAALTIMLAGKYVNISK